MPHTLRRTLLQASYYPCSPIALQPQPSPYTPALAVALTLTLTLTLTTPSPHPNQGPQVLRLCVHALCC